MVLRLIDIVYHSQSPQPAPALSLCGPLPTTGEKTLVWSDSPGRSRSWKNMASRRAWSAATCSRVTALEYDSLEFKIPKQVTTVYP